MKSTEIKAIETPYNGYRFRSRLEARWAVFFDALGVKYEYEPEGFLLPSGKRYLPDFKVKCYGKRGGFSSYDPTKICVGCKHLDKYAANNSDIASWFSGFCEYCDPEKDWHNPPDWIKMRDLARGRTEITECSRREKEDNSFDLWIEVKGEMTQEDADKIYEFTNQIEIEHDGILYYEIQNPVLIVGDIPNPDTYYADSTDLGCYEPMNGIDICPWNYKTIDGDYFAAYPAVENGCFYLDGDDSNYQTMDLNIIREAFRKARQARFEHGETPSPVRKAI